MRIDDFTQHHHGNHGRLLLGWFTMNPYSDKVKQLLLFLTRKEGTDILGDLSISSGFDIGTDVSQGPHPDNLCSTSDKFLKGSLIF